MSQLVERFDTQARLLSTVRKDGHRAAALDTGNAYSYIQGVGWTQLVPIKDPVTGGALIAGQPLVAQGTGSVAYGSPNTLLPDATAPGQILTAGSELAPQYVSRDTLPATMPVDFSDGALHSIAGQTIPGGALGPNGWVRLEANIRVITNAVRTVSVSFPSSTLDANCNTSANTYSIVVEYRIQNQGSETDNATWMRLTNHRFTLGATTSTEIEVQQQSIDGVFSTDADWLLNVSVIASAAVTGTASVDSCITEYAYVA